VSELSFQLYSARNVTSLGDFIDGLASLGYRQVEGFGGLYADADSLAARLKQNAITMPTGHFGLDQIEDTSSALKIAETLGVKRIYCPWIAPEQRGTADASWVQLAEPLAKAAEAFTAEGYGFGWHNHDFEFVPTSSGRLPMDIILETAPKLEWECDVAWMVRGKVDPLDWFDRHGSRVSAVHVKDIAVAGEALDEDGWADVGHGVLAWETLFGKVKEKTKVQYFVAEHDAPSDPMRFARRSMETWSSWAV